MCTGIVHTFHCAACGTGCGSVVEAAPGFTCRAARWSGGRGTCGPGVEYRRYPQRGEFYICGLCEVRFEVEKKGEQCLGCGCGREEEVGKGEMVVGKKKGLSLDEDEDEDQEDGGASLAVDDGEAGAEKASEAVKGEDEEAVKGKNGWTYYPFTFDARAAYKTPKVGGIW
ncbi:hypothetical protein F5Y15DRAFT_426787 [Xylariaceae sp. FL0016]|nr:hypothetical protein F5Y15DRAFT_426787 [Xylariaceae sp. FL0016]